MLPVTALREISILRGVRCENVVGVGEVAVGEGGMGDVWMVGYFPFTFSFAWVV